MHFTTTAYAGTPAPPAASTWFVGLDLGQATDFTAIAVLERQPVPGRILPSQPPPLYLLHHLQRFDLGTPYTDLVTRVVALLGRPAKAGSNIVPLRGCVFGLDATGVGRPVVDMFKAARPPCRLYPVTITGGQHPNRETGEWHVPKKDLVAVMQLLLQSRRLKWDERLPFGDRLKRELADFQVRLTTTAREQFGVWREGEHDDLVLAVAIACWLAERAPPSRPMKPQAVPGMTEVLPRAGARANGFIL